MDIHLYDSQGRHTGKNAQGGIDEQIPNSEYLEYPTLHRKSIIIHGSDINDGYRFEAAGNGTGPADLIVTAPDHPGGSVDTLNYNTVQVNPELLSNVVFEGFRRRSFLPGLHQQI